MKIFPRPRIFYVSPWLLAAATGLLVLIVVTFTLNNIKREKELMTQALLQKATTLIRILHSGSKAGYFNDLGKGTWTIDPWTEYVQRVVSHVVEDPDVRILAVVDESGTVVVHNNTAEIGKQLDLNLPEQYGQGEREPSPVHRVYTDPEEGKIFEAIRPFFPYRPFARAMPHGFLNRPRGQRQQGGMMMPRRFNQESVADRDLDPKRYYVLVGLDMGAYDQALRRLKLQALVLSLTMLLVGIGGWLSLAAVQSYRVSQKTLGDIRAFTSLLIAKLPVGIIATDQEGRITTWNNAATEMTAVSAEKATGAFPEDILPPDFTGFFSPDGKSEQGTGTAQGREREITLSVAGKKQFFLCHSIAVRDNQGEYKGQVLLLSNLTELKSLEKEMRENERLAAVGRMAAGVAHEVRNPLSSIKGLALLLKGKFDQESRERETAGLLIQEVERMNRTISELLSFARPPSLDLQNVSLRELLEENLQLIASDTQSNDIKTRLEVAGDLRTVSADRDRLNQVFINLLLNAVQAMESGGELLVSAKNSTDATTVLVTVQDTGCGIEPAHLPQLFYPYFTTKQGGTGIGLAISQKIISDHKGSIRIESTPGQGTTVTVELPVYSEKKGSNS